MIMTVLRQQPRAAGLVLGLIAANLLAWCWALQAFGDSGALMAASLLAWGYGLRHAVDADHIAAIDNVTRKMMQQGRRPFAVGAWFSLGHSSIVVLASAAIAATATAFSTQMSWLHDTGSVIGTAVSALFLLAMAFINLVILRSVWRSFRAWKRGEPVSDEIVSGGGVMSWLFGKTFRLISRSWQMYLVGFLFGLGFDTASVVFRKNPVSAVFTSAHNKISDGGVPAVLAFSKHDASAWIGIGAKLPAEFYWIHSHILPSSQSHRQNQEPLRPCCYAGLYQASGRSESFLTIRSLQLAASRIRAASLLTKIHRSR